MHGTCMVRIIVLCSIAYWCLYKVSNTFSFTFSTIKSLAAKGKRLGDDDDVASLVKLLDQQVVQHGKEVRKLKDRNERQLKALDDTITRLEERLETLTELCRLKARNEHIAPCMFRMSHFHQFKTGYMSWFSPGFYTHPFGYKMQLKMDANGSGTGRGSHLSVYLCITKGDYDDSLKWPLQYRCFITLLNQLEDKWHHTEIVAYMKDIDDELNSRMFDEPSINCGWGRNQFIAHQKLDLQHGRHCQYLKDDTLYFLVEVENLS